MHDTEDRVSEPQQDIECGDKLYFLHGRGRGFHGGLRIASGLRLVWLFPGRAGVDFFSGYSISRYWLFVKLFLFGGERVRSWLFVKLFCVGCFYSVWLFVKCLFLFVG